MTINKLNIDEANTRLQKQMEECNNDFSTWLEV